MEPEGVCANDSTGSATTKAETPGGSVSRQTKVEKYNLRRSSLVKRLQIEEKSRLPREPKPKVKPPPLSKYRRRSANARERNRMNEMNVGFERLREALPDLDSSKMTKLALLRLAMNYITSLRSILDKTSSTGNLRSILDKTSSTGNLSTSSDGETISPDTPLTSGLPFNLPADNSEFGSCSDLTSCFSYNNTCRGSGGGSSYCTSSGESSGGSTYSSSSGDEASFSPVSDFLLSDGCTDDLINLNLDDLLS